MAANRATRSGGNVYRYGYGGGIYASAVSVTASNTTVDANYLYMPGNYAAMAYGGVMYLSGGDATFTDCLFTNNYNYGLRTMLGGTIYASGLAGMTVQSCTFTLNCGYGGEAGELVKKGGVMYLAGGSGTVIDSCAIVTNGTSLSHIGDLYLASGTLNVSNTLIAANRSSGIVCAGGTLNVSHATLAYNSAWGLNHAAGVVTVTNSIAWGNGSGGIDTNSSVTVAYTCGQKQIDGTGNLFLDPLFVDAPNLDFHLQSRAGHWTPLDWVRDVEDSPCIDAGDKTSPFALELDPNGGHVNMGAYGNTSYASKTAVAGCVFLIR